MFDIAFHTFDEIINMKGHGIYVWTVLAIVIASLLIFFISLNIRIKKLKKKLNEPN